jgi:hypothetical protein
MQNTTETINEQPAAYPTPATGKTELEPVLVGSASYGLATLIIDDTDASNSGKYVCIADPAGLHLFNYTILAYIIDVGEYI